MGRYVVRRLLNYVILLFLAVTLTYFLASTQLHPRMLYQLINPPLDPVSIDQNLYSRNLNDKTPIFQRYLTWLQQVVFHWNWGESPRGASVNDEVGRRMFVSLRLITLGSRCRSAIRA